MPDEIRVNEDRGIIEVHSYGMVSKEDIAESITKVRQILNVKQISKILVDTTKQETMPSTIDTFELFSTFSLEFKLALLIEQSQMTAEDITFAETVGVNRGVRVKIFHEKKQALQWLDSG
jgi:hypothetical protein